MLLNLLPGLRDLRAPLSAGYLWLAAGWLYFAPQLPASVEDAQGVLKDIYRVVDASDPIAIAAGLTFVAYILGILSTMLNRPLRFIVRLPVYFLTIPLLAFMLLLIELSEHWPIIEEKFDKLSVRIVNWRHRFLRSSFPSINDAVLRKLAGRVLKDESFRAFLLIRLREGQLQKLLSSPYTEGSYALGRIQHVRSLMYDRNVNNEDKTKEILDSISGLVKRGNVVAAEVLIEVLVDIDRHAREVRDELALVPERLVGDKPATYERWDRLRAESEFRQAITLPLYAIVYALVVRGVLSWPSVLLFIVPPTVILMQGIGKENEADRQLIQVLEANVTTTASMDRLMTRDLYFIR
jgi:hypothetical protein